LFEASPEFEAWIDEHGSPEFYRWLLTHPNNFKLPWVALVRNLNFLNLQYADGTQARPISAYLIWFYAYLTVPWWIWLFGILIPVLSRWLLNRFTADSLFVLALMFSLYVQAYVGYHGDRAEVSRHVILALVLYKMTALLALVTIVRTLVEWRREQTARSADPPRPRRGPAGKTRGKRRSN
jgi:hypothetical protein